MDNYSSNNLNQNQWNSSGASSEGLAVKAFMTNVFGWMFGALVITALASYAFSHVPSLAEMLYRYKDGRIVGFQGLSYVLMFAPFLLVMGMNLAFNRLSFAALIGMFILFAAMLGASLSTLFIRYNLETIGASFAITAGMFGTMAVMGYTTKADLTKFGSLMLMGLFGIIIASVVNLFMHSEAMGYIISFVGVAVFTGLTAYDVQKLKQIGAGVTYGNESAAKLSIMGAMSLYLDFINLFLFILRLMGGNRK